VAEFPSRDRGEACLDVTFSPGHPSFTCRSTELLTVGTKEESNEIGTKRAPMPEWRSDIMTGTVAVAAEQLVKVFPGDVRAVNGISFAVEEGEAFGLLGPNGAGKTTTIGMLNSTVTPTSGRAMLGGRDVALDPYGTRAMSSVVFQESVVDFPLTGRQNLALHLKLWGVDTKVGQTRLDQLTATVGIDGLLDRPVAGYSGGERRRLEIVRALLSAPRVLFLDEPTVGLDTRIRHDLFDIIATLRDRTGVTIIMTTHYLDEAERLCDRLAIVDAGTIVACDSPSRLLADVGSEVLDLRVDEPAKAVDVLEQLGIPSADILVIGGTITASLRDSDGARLLQLLGEYGIPIRTATTRKPTLDDVYLRLTGDRISGASD
jgi:ABC-2 type transport system ATP-binding protein